ncbi:Regulator of G-protein signaling 16 [Basidiobolus ranarum]|uniref:Regulator of G-protein signaling 16 n=1 Tax=Basidiobolus ranarum TaxID=34480 RepID=A0ABR2W2G0_9FUNG
MLDSNNAHINATTEVLNRRMFPKGGWLRRLLTPQAHIIGIAVWMLPHIVLAIALHYALLKTQKDYDLTIVVAHCIDGWYWTPVLGIFIVYTVGVLPIIFYYLRGIKDAYDMRLEVLWDICIGAISTIASLLSTELDNNESISKVFPNQMWTALMCICMYFISVVIPFREKRRFQALHPSKNGSFPVFEDILNNYSLFREFHAFSVRDFSVENPSFYHRANQWRIDMKRIEGTAYSPLRTKLHAEAHEIYETFISNHADFEINIKGETSQRIYFDISQTMIESTVFDRALLEVVDMMYQQTFPRFLRYKGWVNGNGY